MFAKLTINTAGKISTSGDIVTTGTGTITSNGLITASNGFTVTAGGETITAGGLNVNNTGITSAGAISGATTIGATTVKEYRDSFEKDGGRKTALGGYQSNFWKWQDLEASNEFGDAVFRGIQNTLIQRGMGDSPFFADNFIGMFFHTFTGWGFCWRTNR